MKTSDVAGAVHLRDSTFPCRLRVIHGRKVWSWSKFQFEQRVWEHEYLSGAGAIWYDAQCGHRVDPELEEYLERCWEAKEVQERISVESVSMTEVELYLRNIRRQSAQADGFTPSYC
jgi:hypothetical protein